MAAVSFALIALGAWAQQTPMANPHTSPEDVAAGGRIFRAHCAICHGEDGTGGRGSDLTRGVFRHATNDEDLLGVVSNGIPGTEMPGIFFNGTQLWQIVAYVRSLSAHKSDTKVAGNPAAGKEIFVGKGGCEMCHMVNGEGGHVGPDLSMIGDMRAPEHLKTSILKPNDRVLPQDWSIRAVTRDGQTITGRRLNEDTYSIQLLDSQDRLLSLAKADLTKYEVVRESSMPSYEGKLSGTELQDLIAYLVSLQRKTNP